MENKFTYNKSTKALTITFLFLLLSSTIFAQTKIQSGSWSVSPSLENYSLDNNNGERSMTIEILFEEGFEKRPELFLSVSQIDASNKTNIRYSVNTISVSRDGFTLKIVTWSDSKIFSISGSWIAHTN